jgi:TRAP-type uncharacterized transport system fused permease subunit
VNYVYGLVAALALAFVFSKVAELIVQRTGWKLNRILALVLGLVLVLVISYALRPTGLEKAIIDGLALGPALGLYIGFKEPLQPKK